MAIRISDWLWLIVQDFLFVVCILLLCFFWKIKSCSSHWPQAHSVASNDVWLFSFLCALFYFWEWVIFHAGPQHNIFLLPSLEYSVFTELESSFLSVVFVSLSVVILVIYIMRKKIFLLFIFPVPRSLGMNASVTIEGTSTMYKLPIAPLIMGSHPVDNKW